jgi:hypothetical protein
VARVRQNRYPCPKHFVAGCFGTIENLCTEGNVKAAFIILAFLFSVPSIHQEVKHAPTVDQCQADQRLWLSKLEDDRGTNDVKFETLEAWQREMKDCKEVDEINGRKYFNVMTEIEAEFSRRELDFIVRHNQFDQFLAEDTAGKR